MGERKPLKQPSRDFLFHETGFPHLRSQPASSTFRLVLHCKHHYHQVRSDVAPPLVKHARYYWLLLAEGHLTRRLFGDMLRRIWALPVPGG